MACAMVVILASLYCQLPSSDYCPVVRGSPVCLCFFPSFCVVAVFLARIKGRKRFEDGGRENREVATGIGSVVGWVGWVLVMGLPW